VAGKVEGPAPWFLAKDHCHVQVAKPILAIDNYCLFFDNNCLKGHGNRLGFAKNHFRNAK